MAKDKKSFVLYADLIKNIEHLTNEEKGILFNHLLLYVNDFNPILEDRLILTAWKPIENQLKRDLKKFENVKEKRSLAGKISAEKRKQNSTNLTSVESVQQTSTNPTVNDNVNVNVNVNDIKNNKVVTLDFSKLLEFINKETKRNFRTINEKTKSKYNARIKEGYLKIDIQNAVVNACKTQYHKDNGYQYLTPEFFSRSDILDKYASKLIKEVQFNPNQQPVN